METWKGGGWKQCFYPDPCNSDRTSSLHQQWISVSNFFRHVVVRKLESRDVVTPPQMPNNTHTHLHLSEHLVFTWRVRGGDCEPDRRCICTKKPQHVFFCRWYVLRDWRIKNWSLKISKWRENSCHLFFWCLLSLWYRCIISSSNDCGWSIDLGPKKHNF